MISRYTRNHHMRTAIEHILAAAVLAPSGDNCQPWRFEVARDTIDVHLLSERDTSLYGVGHFASYIAHGALLENIAIAARSQGVQATISEFPTPHNQFHTARITLSSIPTRHDPLASAIAERCSNRKPYLSTPLTPHQRNALREAGGNDTLLIEDGLTRKLLASSLAANEKVLFENRAMHTFFFDHMLWTAHAAAANPIGFHPASLELPAPIYGIWPAFRHWPIMATLTSLGFANAIAFGNAPIYASGAALACITIAERSARDYLHSGRALQRLWLTATDLGLSAQILTGIPLLMNAVRARTPSLSPKHARFIEQHYTDMQHLVGAPHAEIAFFLRVGMSPKPSARTPRAAPTIT